MSRVAAASTPPLTADLFALAIIASAGALGVSAPGYSALTIMARGGYPAAVAIALETKRHLVDVCRLIRVSPADVASERLIHGAPFREAQDAARAIIRAHLGTPAEVPVRPPSRPPVTKPAAKVVRLVTSAPTSLRDQILSVLADAPCTAPNLAFLCDAKELPVSESLRSMEHDRLVVPGAVPVQGVRHRVWALTGGPHA